MADEFKEDSAFSKQAKGIKNQILDLGKAIPELKALGQEYTEVMAAFSDSTLELGMGLGKVIGIQQQFSKGIRDTIKNMTFFQESNKRLNKEFGLNSEQAGTFGNKLRDVAVNLKIGDDKIFDYATSLKGLTAGTITSTKILDKHGISLVKTQNLLRTNLQLDEEQAIGFEQFAATRQQSSAKLINFQKELSDTLAEKFNMKPLQMQKEITAEIGSLTEDMQMQYGRIPGSLEIAVVKAKRLGMSMTELNNAGRNLLDIESSIGQEMEYQLLSGRRLTTADGKSLTNAYRMATIQGDASKQADLMNRLVTEQGDILEKNLYARKKAAELMGTDEATIARSIQKQRILTKLGATELVSLSAKELEPEILKLRKKYEGNDAALENIDKLVSSMDTRTPEAKSADFLASIDSKIIKGTSIDVAGMDTKITDGLKRFEQTMTMFSGKTFQTSIGKLATTGEVVASITNPLVDLTKKIPKLGAAIATAVESLQSAIPKFSTAAAADAKDAVIMNDGLIKFHRDDKIARVNDSTMVASTSTGGIRDYTKALNQGAKIDYDKMAAAIVMALRTAKFEVKTDTLFKGRKF